MSQFAALSKSKVVATGESVELGDKPRGKKTVLVKVEFRMPANFTVSELYLRHKSNGATLYRLNGTAILDVPDELEEMEEICLKRNNSELLQPGINVLTAELQISGRHNTAELECEVLRQVGTK